MPSRSEPIASTTSASSHSLPAHGHVRRQPDQARCVGSARRRRRSREHRRGERSASRATSAPAPRAPPPTHSSGRSAAARRSTAASRPPFSAGGSSVPVYTSPSGTSAASRSVAISRYTGRAGSLVAVEHRGGHRRADALDRQRAVRRLGHGREHRRLVGGLVQDAAVGAGTAQRRRDVGRDDEDRRARRPRLADRPERVRRARAGRRQRDAEPPGRARVAVGRVGRGLLVADADEPDRGRPAAPPTARGCARPAARRRHPRRGA